MHGCLACQAGPENKKRRLYSSHEASFSKEIERRLAAAKKELLKWEEEKVSERMRERDRGLVDI